MNKNKTGGKKKFLDIMLFLEKLSDGIIQPKVKEYHLDIIETHMDKNLMADKYVVHTKEGRRFKFEIRNWDSVKGKLNPETGEMLVRVNRRGKPLYRFVIK